MRDPKGCGVRGEWLERDPPGRAGTFLCLNRDVGRGRLGAALALLAALAVDGVVRLQLSVGLLGAGEGAEDPVPRLPVGTAWIGPPPGAVLQQLGAGAGGLRGCSHLGLAWGKSSVLPPRLPSPPCSPLPGEKLKPRSPATAWDPCPQLDMRWPHGWDEAMLTDKVQEDGDGNGDAEEDTAGGKETGSRGMKKEQEIIKPCCEGRDATAKTHQSTWRRWSPGVPALPARAGGTKPLRPTGVAAETQGIVPGAQGTALPDGALGTPIALREARGGEGHQRTGLLISPGPHELAA